MNLKAGLRLCGQACSREVIVVRPPGHAVDVYCGGAPMVPVGTATEPVPVPPADSGGTLLGKRDTDDASGLELLCTKAGAGSLSLGDTPPRPEGRKISPVLRLTAGRDERLSPRAGPSSGSCHRSSNPPGQRWRQRWRRGVLGHTRFSVVAGPGRPPDW
jgi:hypothetical protein